MFRIVGSPSVTLAVRGLIRISNAASAASAPPITGRCSRAEVAVATNDGDEYA